MIMNGIHALSPLLFAIAIKMYSKNGRVFFHLFQLLVLNLCYLIFNLGCLLYRTYVVYCGPYVVC